MLELIGILIYAISYGSAKLYFFIQGQIKVISGFTDKGAFSKSNNIELSYNSFNNYFNAFSDNYHHLYGMNMRGCYFDKGKYRHSVFSYGEDNVKQSGVIVSIYGKESVFSYMMVVENYLVNVISLRRCDVDDALGCYSNSSGL
ncbi:hypothetical protein [Aeromonas jandaei]|uniref:hypothetical protein n=1 Tax=Aeromonas jandaei TaxID=650 RepID=UPI0039886C02